jgi:Sulfotransferase family
MQQHENRNDLIITGLPRSGTSLLCFLLNSAEDVAVINEPNEIFEILLRPNGGKSSASPRFEDLKAYHADIRRQLAAGQPVPNKVVMDTRHEDVRVSWRPRAIHGPDFLLGTKNTLLYTCNLQSIVRDGFRVIALVRHPYQSISSWRSFDKNRGRFAHLQCAIIPFFDRIRPNAFADDLQAAYLALRHKPNDLNDLCSFWNLLTRTYLNLGNQIMIVPYEDFVRNSRDSIRATTEVVVKDPMNSNSSPRYHDISASDQAFIWERCRENAQSLGYSPTL